MLRWGVLGPGRISRSFLDGVAGATEGRAVAVGSRDGDRARAVADKFGVPRSYGSYQAVLADPEVDAVYIGLPNGLHGEWSIAAAKAGKHVLCEKPLASDTTEALAMAAAAEEHGVGLVEAFMYRFHPRTIRLAEMIRHGAIGEVRAVSASFGFVLDDSTDVRLDAGLAGGALMDVGSYCVNVSRLIAGVAPTRVSAFARWAPSGVDLQLVGDIEYPNGVFAQISCDFGGHHNHSVRVVGTEGVIDVPESFVPPRDEPATLLLFRDGQTGNPEEIAFRPVNQYTAEADGFARLVENGGGAGGAGEAGMPLAETVQNMATIDALLRSARDGHPELVRHAPAG